MPKEPKTPEKTPNGGDDTALFIAAKEGPKDLRFGVDMVTNMMRLTFTPERIGGIAIIGQQPVQLDIPIGALEVVMARIVLARYGAQ